MMPVSMPEAPAEPAARERFVSTAERVRGRSWRWRLLGLFSSVKMAATLIAAFAIIIGGATWYERDFGRDAAGEMIYRTRWFAGLFVLLALNIFGAAAVRWPWRRRQTGFVLVHAGLLTLIAGFFLAGNDRLDGQLAAPPGREVSQIELPRDSLSVAIGDQRAEAEFQPLTYAGYPAFARFLIGKLLPWWCPIGDPGIHRLAQPVTLLDERRDGATARLLAMCDTARAEPAFVAADSADAAPAARVTLIAHTPMMPPGHSEELASRWLSPAGERVVSFDPLIATLARTADARLAADFLAPSTTAARGAVRVYWHGERHEIEVPATLPATIDVAPDLALEIDDYIANPTPNGERLVQDDAKPLDPFLMTRVGVGAPAERRWANATLSAHYLTAGLEEGMPELLYDHPSPPAAPGTAPALLGGWLELLAGPDGRLHLRWFTRSKGLAGTATVEGATWEGDLVGGESTPMRLRARIDWLPRAVAGPEPVVMQSDHEGDATRWIEVEAEHGGHHGRAWIARGDAKAIVLDDGTQVLARYGPAIYSLMDRHGFALTLEHFEVGQDPGAQSKASYASDVSVRPISDEERGAAERRNAEAERRALERMRDDAVGRWVPPALSAWLRATPTSPPRVESMHARIEMNAPLHAGGVTLYQSSYFDETDQDGHPTGRQVSVFTVAQDHGRWCKYLGSALLVGGILTMYLMRLAARSPR
jgi:hypothetical protein